jgi:hypothetical protein
VETSGEFRNRREVLPNNVNERFIIIM